MEILFEYLIFLLKALTVAVAIVIPILIVISSIKSSSGSSSGGLRVKNLSTKYANTADDLKLSVLSAKERKVLEKNIKKENKNKKKEKVSRKHIFVLNFNGDIEASQVEELREEISSILNADTKCQEVVLNLESGGGTVIGYGLAAAQLSRLKDSKIKLTVCIDKVAASGGYMMACIADKIIASPFAIIGSIGVIGAVPNFNKLLKKNNIEYEMHTAGEYKRTITMFGENSDEGREKFKDDLANIHELFKKHVSKYRPSLDVDKVATGEVWQGIEAIDVGLVDKIQTSDSYLIEQNKKFDIFEVSFKPKKNMQDRFSRFLSFSITRTINKIFENFSKQKFM